MQETNDSTHALSSDQLLYRSQFILGPSFVDEFKSWKRIRVNDSIYLTVHPNLSTSQAIYRDKSITLLGFMLDPDNSEVSDFDIVSNLVRSFFSCDDLFRRTTKFGGRWILIANDGRETRLFNDATGLRQVYYTDIHQAKDIWCASQPGIVARMLNLQMDEEAVDFINYIRFKKEYWWPGDSSPYKEIKHLLPNHYLNLETGHCYRYWPSRGLNELALDEAIEKISRTLSGLMQSASNRFDLALASSSGWDSRLVLASCREIRHRISYYSTRKPGMPRNHADIKVPSRLLSRLGLKHDIIDQNVELRGEFVEIFKKNVPFAHDQVLPRMQANLDHYNLSKVAVTGSVSEVARCHYRLPESEKVTALKLSSLAPNMEDHPFVIKFFEKWLQELGKVYSFNVLDLFMWEQDSGSWLAMSLLEFDTAWRDIFCPFNTRSLLIDLLSVDEQYRRPPKYELYEKLIFSLWPEVLCEPINPHYHKKGYKYRVRRYARSSKRKLSHIKRSTPD